MAGLIDGAAVVRDANPGDAEALARVEVTTWQASYDGILPRAVLASMSVPRATARWLRLLGMPGRSTGRVSLVSVIDGEVIGFLSGGTTDPNGARMASLDMLYVLPEHQARGVGGELLHDFATRMSGIGVSALWVDVLAKNARARRFYRHRGGIELARTWSYVRTTPIAVVSYGWSLPDGLARM